MWFQTKITTMKKNSINTKKPTLVVVIPALNEEINIEKTIKQVLAQKRDSFELKNIIVYSDNSTDNTHQIVSSLAKKNSRIVLKKGERRIGKYYRMSQAFQELKADIFIVLDADISLVGRLFLENLSRELAVDNEALMVAAHQEFIRPKGLIPRAIYAHFMLWNYVRFSLPDLNVAQNFYGSATAFRGTFAHTIKIPKNISDPHLYIYLMAAKKHGFRYSKKATMLQWPITTMKDFNRLLKRSLGKKDERLEKIFAVKTEDIYFVPFKCKIIGILKSLIYDPIGTPFGIFLGMFAKWQLKKDQSDKNAMWAMADSTKKTI